MDYHASPQPPSQLSLSFEKIQWVKKLKEEFETKMKWASPVKMDCSSSFAPSFLSRKKKQASATLRSVSVSPKKHSLNKEPGPTKSSKTLGPSLSKKDSLILRGKSKGICWQRQKKRGGIQSCYITWGRVSAVFPMIRGSELRTFAKGLKI